MGLRVRKSIKIMPGVRLNISKSGVSTSIGVKGATVNLKPGRKARVTVGIPGTGLSYTSTASSRAGHEQAALQAPARKGLTAREVRFAVLLYIIVVACAIRTESWTFITFITVCAAIFIARRRSKAKQDVAEPQ